MNLHKNIQTKRDLYSKLNLCIIERIKLHGQSQLMKSGINNLGKDYVPRCTKMNVYNGVYYDRKYQGK
jgi:hypothetical protein